jgi:hypothetical protein
MKKGLIVAMILALATPGFSQMVGSVVPISFGPKVVVNQSMISQDNSIATIRNSIGGGVGGYFRLNITDFIIQPEVYVNYRGNGFDLPVTDDENGYMYNFDYSAHFLNLDIPVLLGYQAVTVPLFNLRFHAGPVLNLKVAEYVKINDASVKVDESASATNIKDGIEESDQDFENMFYGAQFGVGMDIWKLTVDVRYELGLSPFAIEHDADDFPLRSKMIDPDMNQNMFHVSLGFKII